MTQEVVDRLLVRIKGAIFAMDPVMPLFSDAIQDPHADLEKHSIFKPVSKTEEVRKTTPRASKKHQKSTLEAPINDFWENMVFAISSMRNPCFESANCQ